jgi:hypothetical protein
MWIKEASKIIFILMTIATMSVFFYMLIFSMGITIGELNG